MQTAVRDVTVTCNQRSLHVDHRSIDIPRQGPRTPRPFAQAGPSPRSDLGARRAREGLRAGSPPSVACGGTEPTRSSGSGVRRRNLRVGCRVKRGEIWTVAGGAAYAGKPRPAVIVCEGGRKYRCEGAVRGPCADGLASHKGSSVDRRPLTNASYRPIELLYFNRNNGVSFSWSSSCTPTRT